MPPVSPSLLSYSSIFPPLHHHHLLLFLRYLDREGMHEVVGWPTPIHIYICIYMYVHIYIYISIKKGLHRVRQPSAFTGPTVLPYTHMILDTAAACVAVRMSTCVRAWMREYVSGWMFDWLCACVRWWMHSAMKWGWGILLQGFRV